MLQIYGLFLSPTRNIVIFCSIFTVLTIFYVNNWAFWRIHAADPKSQMDKQSFTRALIPRFTSFRNLSPDTRTYSQIVEAISTDEVRNKLIVEDVRKAIEESRTPIILTNLTSHVRLLAEMLSPYANHVITLVGADSTKEKRLAMEQLQAIPDSESMVIIATGKYIGEGFDYPRLDTLFLVSPISWKGSIAQYAGRLHIFLPFDLWEVL